nr:class I SAM-dependent methyltransferase [Pleurocapsa sp. PCC 7319]
MKLEEVVPFGRSLDEYIKMFNLSPSDLRKRILGVGDGPASFNAEGTARGAKITSIDPIYQFSGVEIKQRFDAVVDNIIDQIIATPKNWVWSYHQSPQALKASRIKTLEIFLQDYEQGFQEGRYLAQELPQLDFTDQTYDLALCSHFLFLYSEHCDRDFHSASIKEMLRVSREVRIFPLLTLMQETSPYLDGIMAEFINLGYSVTIEEVPYELQPGGNKMLVIKMKKTTGV